VQTNKKVFFISLKIAKQYYLRKTGFENLFYFMQYYSLQCISWLMLFVSADQCVKLYFPTWIYSRKTKYVYPICLVRIKLFFKHFIIDLSIVINDLSILKFFKFIHIGWPHPDLWRDTSEFF